MDEDEKSRRAKQHAARAAQNAERMRVRRAMQRMAQEELLAKLEDMEQEQHKLKAKLSCQMESLAQGSLHEELCITPPRVKNTRSPTLGSGNGRSKSNKVSTSPTLTPYDVTPDKVMPNEVTPPGTPGAASPQRSLPSPLSIIRFLHAIEKVPPTLRALCTFLTVACMCAAQESPVTADKLVEDFTIKELMTIMGPNFPSDEDDLDAEFQRYLNSLNE